MIGKISVETAGPGLYEITGELARFVSASGDGVLTALIRHTSASLLIQENADPDVQTDLLAWLDRSVPQSDDPSMHWITHRYEGPDDMPAHLKAAMLPTTLSIPVQSGRMMLGRWQGVYIVEHRTSPHRREVALVFNAC
ncbi:secondary thiamine-phosphate synthase enzyme YjbQ [Paracoccus sp. SCSIO 75233]|uniref:secondary thiamine-phosphate synthase enzyme YjbQ n=1 Tax=Paracoccus sp. SCSIO 75233 TaxID=3017782 RepID=UPI0022F07B2B|nr:secondary thiamine-phosphate synthase enzyme YjbQ [Paracoccus sp. SCSIO 75233]WBU54412.1 secondary thiamine-phosphate synthase enzyme YjbQ [Paracoccus sp. SCSIO 75233]